MKRYLFSETFQFLPIFILPEGETVSGASGNERSRHSRDHGVAPLAARSPNQTFRQQDGIVAEEKLEVLNDNLLDLFFGLELNLGIECTSGSEEHGGDLT